MKVKALVCALALMVSTAAVAADAKAPAPADDDNLSLYSLGQLISENLKMYGLNADELEKVKEGLTDGVLGKESKLDAAEMKSRVHRFADARRKRMASEEKKASAAFLDKIAAEDGVVKTDSGLLYKEIAAGDGASPKPTDRVKVHYVGTLRDGTVFDSSRKRGTPATFPLNRVIKCWTEGVQRMKVGGKARLVCPSDIAYGDRGAPPKINPGAALVFEVELLEILEGAKKAGAMPPGHP